jgi:hypothetical protein
MDDSEKFANFMFDIRQLRAAGYDISNSQAYDLFMGAIAREIRDGQQALGLGQGILPEAPGERSALPGVHRDE